MTREELRDYVDKQRGLDNIPYHVYSTLIDGIDELEQESILEEIRAEVEALPKTYPFTNHIDTYVKEDDVKKIIDKYMVESEGEK